MQLCSRERGAPAATHGTQVQQCTRILDEDAIVHGMQMQLRTGYRCNCVLDADAAVHGMQRQLRAGSGPSCRCNWGVGNGTNMSPWRAGCRFCDLQTGYGQKRDYLGWTSDSVLKESNQKQGEAACPEPDDGTS